MKNRMMQIFSTIASVTCLAFSTTAFAADPPDSTATTTAAPATETKAGPVKETTETTAVMETTTPAVHLSRPAEEVLKLSRAKLSEGAIVAYIMNSGSTYSLTVSEILYLREQGVSDFVITTMLDQSRKLKDGYRTGYARTYTTNEDGTVVIGIIDDGIAFANARFRTATDLTRVEHIWLQDGDYNAAAARYGYGCSFSKHGSGGIDELLRSSTYGGIVDEEEFYTKVGALGFGEMSIFRTTALRSSHGTHVMDIACGYLPGAAPNRAGTRGEDNRPIVCVQLPAATSEGTSGASLDTFVVDGIKYILDKADEIAVSRNCGPLPVVINFSYGTIAGRHDGTSDIERAIDELICHGRREQASVQVVIPAGNSRLSRCHARESFSRKASFWKRGSSKSLDWRVLPDDRTTTHLEIWLPRGAHGPKSRITLSVKPPFGQTSKPLGETFRPVRVWGQTVEQGLCEVRYSHVPEPTNRGMFLVTLKATVPVENTNTGKMEDTVAPAGLWTITLENISLGPDDVVDAWIQRDDTRYGHLPFGRQSYFDDSKYERFSEDGKVPTVDQPKSAVKRAGTLNGIATGERTIIIGGFQRKSVLATDYSGEGRAMSRVGPDALAASDDSIVHSGVLAAGTRSGSVVALTGTSVAAPQITRMVACLLAEGKPADRDAIRAIAESEERRTCEHRPPRPCEERGGAGRIERPLTVPVLRVDEPH
jgi:hypothetical protein